MAAFMEVSTFADRELSALVLLGGSSLNPGLPLTDNQRARQTQLKENEKKAAAARAAIARAAAATNTGGQQPPAAAPPKAPFPQAARLNSTFTNWAKPCHNWTAGECSRGISCHFKHEGIPMEEKRCFICGSKTHTYSQCTCPGGTLDPEKDKHWAEYRERRAAAPAAAGKAGKAGK